MNPENGHVVIYPYIPVNIRGLIRILAVDGSLYRAKSNRTGEKNLTTYWYCGIISKDQNGSTVQFHLTSDAVKITNSTPVLLMVAAGKSDISNQCVLVVPRFVDSRFVDSQFVD